MLNKIKKNVCRNLENKFIKFISSLIILALLFICSLIYDKYYKKINSSDLYQNENLETKDSDELESNFINFEFIGEFIVTGIIDGDTIDVKRVDQNRDIKNNTNNVDRVRIIAVNTLEKNSLDKREKCFANLSTDFTKEKLLDKKVRLYYDKTQPKKDKYHRLLAYVLPDGEDMMYNETLMKSGFSKVYKASPKAIEYDKYKNIMQENMQNKIGIWDDRLCKSIAF